MRRCWVLSMWVLLVGVQGDRGDDAVGVRRWKNLLRNPSFESVGAKGVPVGWHWVEGRAKAALTVDETEARSGKRSIKIVNPTPREPHVYSFLLQEPWVRPGRPYVLSCYMKSAVPGTIWIGGGESWQHRFPFPPTKDIWTRVVGRFTPTQEERQFRVMILTESPTQGVWIDDVMLEEGVEPTEFAMDRPLEGGQAVLTVAPMTLGENLLPNSSFESLEGRVPRDWGWNPRNTDATMTVDDTVARSGRRSLRFTNGTRFGAHVYGSFALAGGAKVKPKTAYTVSAWVRADDPGVAWIGGGTGWRVRCKFPRTHGKWTRVSETFVTGEDDGTIPILIITESPTKGFWVDDVKLEQSGYATPYVPPEGAEKPELEIAIRPARPVMSRRGLVVPRWAPDRYPPGETTFLHRELWVDGALRLPTAVQGARVTVRVADQAGRELSRATQTADLAAGATAIEFGWEVYQLAASRLEVAVSVADARGRGVAAARLDVKVYTVPMVEAELGRAEKALGALKRQIAKLAPRGLGSRALATATVLENFIPYARDDVAHGEVARAYDAAVTMSELAKARIAESDDVLAGRHPGFPAVRYKTSPITIDGPSFVAEAVHSQTGKAERRPVFFVGYGHFGSARRDIEKFPRYGANFIQIEFGPRSVLVSEDEVSQKAIEDFLAVCDRAAKAGVSVNLLLSPHYFPGWAYEKWPHLKNFGGGFLKFDINAPEARAVIERSLRVVIPRIKDHPALHSVCLSNEPVCVDISKSAASVKMWHAWLKKKHGTLDALNEAWGTDHRSFEAILIQTELTNAPVIQDFVRFNQEQFAAWHRWMADVIHSMAPKLPVHAKIMVGAHFGRHHHGIWSVSPQLFGELSQIHGNDCWKFHIPPDHPSAGDWACGWLKENMAYDFQRSMGDKPVFNSENHLIRDRNFRVIPPAFITNVIWQGAIHGQSATTTWVWERTSDPASDAAGSIMHRPACTEAHNLACLDLNRLAREVTAIQKQPPQVALLWSLASNVWHTDHVRVLNDAYTALNFCGVPIGFVTERQMAAWHEGGPAPPALRTAKLLVLPAVSGVPEAAFEGIRKFAAGRGPVRGRAVRVGRSITLDEYHRHSRRDHAVPGGYVSAASARRQWPLLRAELAKAGVRPLAEVVTEEGEPVWGVELRAARVRGKLVVHLCNYTRREQRVRLLVGGKPVGGTDLIPLAKLPAVFSVPSLAPRLIEIAP